MSIRFEAEFVRAQLVRKLFVLPLFTAFLLAGCAAYRSTEAAPLRDVAGQKLEFADLHSANTYLFLPGGRYRFAAVSQNGLHTDRREGVFTFRATGPGKARVIFDDSSVLNLSFATADSGTCKADNDVRVYRFRMSGAR